MDNRGSGFNMLGAQLTCGLVVSMFRLFRVNLDSGSAPGENTGEATTLFRGPPPRQRHLDMQREQRGTFFKLLPIRIGTRGSPYGPSPCNADIDEPSLAHHLVTLCLRGPWTDVHAR